MLGKFRKFRSSLNNQNERIAWVSAKLAEIPARKKLLDAGCGSQRYRKYCDHLQYSGQDFGQFESNEQASFAAFSTKRYEYGGLDYVSDICNIDAPDEFFDAILCTEVLEHIPYPANAIAEFARLLKPGGTLILTAPFACLRHQDPYFFSTGFSDRWYSRVLQDAGFEIVEMSPVGDYWSWLRAEMYRIMRTGPALWRLASPAILGPAFVLFSLKRRNQMSIATLCMGYHVLARRRQPSQ